jgi:hypothetical protein
MTGVIESAEPLVVEADSGLLSGTSEAVFSVDRARRYVLVRLWESVPPMTWIMLNPSTADAFADDPTIKRCKAFARREGCGGINVVNLFAHRSADPAALRQAADPVGPSNDQAIEVYARDASLVVAAWGAGGALNGRAREVGQRLAAAGVRLWCLGVTKGGHPKHPLARGRERVPDNAPLIPWQVPS